MHKQNGVAEMKYVPKLILLFALTLLFINGCSEKPEKKNDIISVIKDNLKYAENEDLDKLMSTIDEQSPQYASTEKIMKRIFKVYDLTYKLESIKVIEKSDDKAKVNFVQVTMKRNGPTFRNNKITGVHTLFKTDGTWNIYITKIDKMEYLN